MANIWYHERKYGGETYVPKMLCDNKDCRRNNITTEYGKNDWYIYTCKDCGHKWMREY